MTCSEFAHSLPLVMVHVAGQVEDPVRLQGQTARFQQLRPRLVGLAIGEGRIGRHEQDPWWLGLGPALREEDALPEVGAAELAVDAPEVEPRRERECPVGCLLDRGVPREHEPVGPPHLGAEHERGERFERLAGQAKRLSDLVDVEMAQERSLDALQERVLDGRGGSAGRGRRNVIEGAPAEETPEPVEAVVPVVIAGNREQHSTGIVLCLSREHAVPGFEQAALELVRGRRRVRGVAAEDQEIAPRQGAGVRPGERVLGKEHAAHGDAQIVVVARCRPRSRSTPRGRGARRGSVPEPVRRGRGRRDPAGLWCPPAASSRASRAGSRPR